MINGDLIRELRENKNLKQIELAKLLNVSQQSIAKYENNKAEAPHKVIEQLANIFNVSIDYFFNRDSFFKDLSPESQKELLDYIEVLKVKDKLKKRKK